MLRAPAPETIDDETMLRRRFERERRARLEAEAIAESGFRDLFEKQRELQAQASEVLAQKRQLEQLNSRFDIALNNMARGLSMWDAEQRLIVCNKMYRDIYELPASLTQPGTSLADIVRFHVKRETGRDRAEDVEKQRKWIERHVATLARANLFSYTQNLKSGRIILVSTQPLQHGGWVDIQEDVTEKHNYTRRLEERVAEKTRELAAQAEELRRSNQELERFAYVASHDLQEPLRMVASFTQLLAKRNHGKLDADSEEFIRYAVDGAIRMQELVNDVLVYSRVSTKKHGFQPVDCERVVDRALANLEAVLEESGARITRDPLPTICADTSLIQLFQNLIANAIKFRSDRRPEIHIGVVQTADGWTFSVRDNGIGIDPKYVDQLFVLFKRLHTRSEYPGTGLGLAICKKIMERHGGRIWIESLLGQGTTFFFTFPNQSENGAQARLNSPITSPKIMTINSEE